MIIIIPSMKHFALLFLVEHIQHRFSFKLMECIQFDVQRRNNPRFFFELVRIQYKFRPSIQSHNVPKECIQFLIQLLAIKQLIIIQQVIRQQR